MKHSKRSICFVDDDPTELRRFRECLKSDFVIGAGKTLRDAVADLNGRGCEKPDLFVLDMYFSRGPETTEQERVELHQAWGRYRMAQDEFLSVLARLRQSSAGGRNLAREVQERYRSHCYVFFTRKGTLEEGLDALKQGALRVIKKPDPNPPGDGGEPSAQEYDLAFKNKAREIASELADVIEQATWWWKHKEAFWVALIGLCVGYFASVLANFTQALLTHK